MKKAPSELSPSGKKKTEIVHVYVLLFAMCIIVALLTYIIPAGA